MYNVAEVRQVELRSSSSLNVLNLPLITYTPSACTFFQDQIHSLGFPVLMS